MNNTVERLLTQYIAKLTKEVDSLSYESGEYGFKSSKKLELEIKEQIRKDLLNIILHEVD